MGFALLSVLAVAQSSDNKTDAAKKSSDTKQGTAAPSGQAKMKMTPEKVEAGTESLKTASEVSTGKATGISKTSAHDDWNAQQRVAAGDVNGDGKADAATSVKSPRDVATGQASGKRQHQPVSLDKQEQKPPSEKK